MGVGRGELVVAPVKTKLNFCYNANDKSLVRKSDVQFNANSYNWKKYKHFIIYEIYLFMRVQMPLKDLYLRHKQEN